MRPVIYVDAEVHYENKQSFLEYSAGATKYHLGDDWNGNGGGSTDIGAPVYAVAEGRVVYARDLGEGEPHEWGKVVVIQHTLPGGGSVFSLYAHLEYYLLPDFCNYSSSPECVIDEGTQIGAIGDGNGYYHGLERCGVTGDGGCAHLHFEMRKRFDPDNAALIPGSGYAEDPSVPLVKFLARDPCGEPEPVEYLEASTNPIVEVNYHNPTAFVEARRAGVCSVITSLQNGRVAAVCSSGDTPSVSTDPAKGITEASATLNLRVNPNRVPTTAWFEWGTSHSLGHSTSRLSAGSSASPVSLSSTLIDLICDQTYYFQSVAENNRGIGRGRILSFHTRPCASGGGTTTTDLIRNGDFQQDGLYWQVWNDFYADRRFGNYHSGPGYAYLSQPDGTRGNDLVGTLYQQISIPPNAKTALLTYWVSITTDEPLDGPADDVLNTTLQTESGNYLSTVEVLSNRDATGGYSRREFDLTNFKGRTIRIHFLGSTNNDTQATVFRIDDVSLAVKVPVASPPTVATESADQIRTSSARLNMRIDPGGANTQVWFDLERDDPAPTQDTSAFFVGSGTEEQSVSFTVANLLCDTRYYFRANASNSEGAAPPGSVLTFRTLDCPGALPSVDTDAAESIAETSARLAAEVNPNELSTQVWFGWGLSSSLGWTSQPQNVGAGTEFVRVVQELGGLECGTTYYFNSFADNIRGTGLGAVHVFSTLPCTTPGNTPPSITVTDPDGVGDLADESFTIRWSDSDPDDDATISLHFSQNPDCSGGSLIAAGLSEDDEKDSYLWDTSSLPGDIYYVLGVITDGVNPSEKSCSPGGVGVEHAVLPIFVDGFESGDSSQWYQVPPKDDFNSGLSSAWRFASFGSNTGNVSWDLISDESQALQGAGGFLTGGGASVAFRTDFAGSDYAVSGRVKVQEVRNGGHHSAIVGRYQVGEGFYELFVNHPHGFVFLSRWVGGQETRLDEREVGMEPLSGWVTLRLEMIGSRIRGFLNGARVVEATDPALASGRAGLMNAGGVTRFDDFRVEELP